MSTVPEVDERSVMNRASDGAADPGSAGAADREPDPTGRRAEARADTRATVRAEMAVARLRHRLAVAGHDLPVQLWDGRRLGPADAGYRLVLPEPWSLRALLVPPNDLQAGETYVAGGVDVEGSMVEALHAITRLRVHVPWRQRAELAATVLRLPRPPERFRGGRVELPGRRHAPERDAAAVRHHYDVGNNFYRLLLDRELVYSCAYFADEDREAPSSDRAVLERAQRRKLELVCRKLALRPGERFLDVGCGWGALVLHAAQTYGVEAVGVTLSQPQAELARKRVLAAGLRDRIRIEVADYRELRDEFDAIASVGMVEHVGSDQLPNYVRQLHRLLAPGGRLLNHGITTGRRNVVRDLATEPDNFVGRYVFPDGALFPTHHVVAALEAEGFEIWDLEQLRPHYARTLRHWVTNLERAYDDACRLVGEPTVRVWRAYLAGSVVGFETNDLGVVQILAARGEANLPLTRRRLLL